MQESTTSVTLNSILLRRVGKKEVRTTHRSTKHECAHRVKTVHGLLLDGLSNSQIGQFAAETWDVSQRQTERYIAEARQLIEEDCAISRQSYLAEILGRLRNYEQQAARRGQLQVATNSVRLQAELVGLTAK